MTMSIIVACLASTAGWRKVFAATAMPIHLPGTRWASAAAVVKASKATPPRSRLDVGKVVAQPAGAEELPARRRRPRSRRDGANRARHCRSPEIRNPIGPAVRDTSITHLFSKRAQDPDNKRIAKRIDADGNVQVGPNWDTLIERQIREAMEHGKFDELPRHGEPLPNDENPYATDMALAFHILKNAGVAPPWVGGRQRGSRAARKARHILKRASTGTAPSEFARKRDRATLTDLVASANGAISKVNAKSPASCRSAGFLSSKRSRR